MTENIHQLAEELFKTATALIARWGNPIRTSQGKIHLAGGTLYIESPSAQTVKIKHDGKYHMAGGPVAGMEASSVLEAMTLYLTSRDFVAKLDGSISRLKKIQKALQ